MPLLELHYVSHGHQAIILGGRPPSNIIFSMFVAAGRVNSCPVSSHNCGNGKPELPFQSPVRFKADPGPAINRPFIVVVSPLVAAVASRLAPTCPSAPM